jgi:hypothetical protein
MKPEFYPFFKGIGIQSAWAGIGNSREINFALQLQSHLVFKIGYPGDSQGITKIPGPWALVQGKKEAAGAPTPAAKLNNFNTPAI